MLQAFTIGRNQNRVDCLLLPEEIWWAGRRFWPFSASCDGTLWVVLCRSWPRSVMVKSDANDWSGRMQMGGQAHAITLRQISLDLRVASR